MDDSSMDPSPDPDDDTFEPERLSLIELRLEIAARTKIVTDISAILDANDLAHAPMDQDYRLRIVRERRYAHAERKLLRQEVQRRMAASGERPKAETARDLRDKSLTQLFVRAAAKMLPADQFQAIWRRARVDSPDHEGWGKTRLGVGQAK